MAFSLEKNNINEFIRLSEPEFNYSCGYYAQNCWVDDSRLVLCRYRNLPDNEFYGGTDLLLVDLKNNTEKILVSNEGKRSISYIVYKNKLYYADKRKTLCCMNVDTLEKSTIYESETPIEQLFITVDGRYMSWFFEDGKKPSVCMRVDLETGEAIKLFEKGFLPPFNVANHFMICPTDPDVLFFAHEGDARYITNRLWLVNKGEGARNIAKQRLDDNGNLLDCFGHESWAADGKGLYFVKYKCSPSEPKGIGYVDIKTGQAEIRYTGYEYWHVCAAPGGKYLAGDLDSTGTGVSGVVLVDTEENTEKLLVRVRNNQSHPGHPHPQFNPSCNRICFHDVVDKDTVTVGIIDI